MLAMFISDFIIVLLLLGGVQWYIEAHIGIHFLTEKIETKWLRTTVRILLRIGAATLIVGLVIGGIIVNLAFSQKEKKGS